LNFFGFEFFRSGETRLGGRDLRWFAKKIKKDSIFSFLFCFSFYASDASHIFLFLNFFGFEFFRFGETRLGGKVLRWFAKEIKKYSIFCFFWFFFLCFRCFSFFLFFELL